MSIYIYIYIYIKKLNTKDPIGLNLIRQVLIFDMKLLIN